MSLERESIYKPGASFFEEDGEVLFQFQSDSSSKIGPRKATNADKAEHSGAWALFNEARAPVDHRPIRPVSDEHVHVEPAPRRGRPPKPKD